MATQRTPLTWLWHRPPAVRAVFFAVAFAVLAVVVGKLITASTGFWCACWIGNLRIGTLAGAAGGALFGFIYEPYPFGRPTPQR